MSILKYLSKKEIWLEFYEYKVSAGHLNKAEADLLRHFIENTEYTETAARLQNGGGFSVPEKKSINKMLTGKKRTVYLFPRDEMYIMKLICFLLYKYDSKLTDSCYSFRRGINAKTAVRKIVSLRGADKKYCVKADIHNYFNSIPAKELALALENIITDDPALLKLLRDLLTLDKAYENGRLITENRGAMAGCPLSPFFANFYLNDIDRQFGQKNICYCRYSDDILFFADTAEEANSLLDELKAALSEKGLALNPEKCVVSAPGEGWEFLGFSYKNGNIDLSRATKSKTKAKIRRKAKALYRWSRKKGLSYDKAARAMIKRFNRKFYDDTHEGDFSWSRWFFPLLTTAEGLKEIDAYMLEYIRFLKSGRHYKGNYRMKYSEIKALGYRSLVNEFYKAKKSRQNFSKFTKF